MGPMLMFDKSALELLSVDESVWLEWFFCNNITPLFYVETLADLEKKPKKGEKIRTPEQIVGEMARKAPINATFPNVHHQTLVVANLLGRPIEMRKRAVMTGGQPKISPDGKISFFYDELPEQKTMQRWQDGEFLEIEREKAKRWRVALSNLSFDINIGKVKNIIPKNTKFQSMEEVKSFVDDFIQGTDKEILYLALDILDIPQEYYSAIIARWEKEGKQKINAFAPYMAYVFSVDLFFYLCLHFKLISEKPSNKIDFAYLYYLPFCRIFVSNDKKTHGKAALLFMMNGQLFIPGEDLKKGMRELDDYFSEKPEEEKAKGVMSFSHFPPREKNLFVTRLWDKLSSNWRKLAEEEKKNKTGFPPDNELAKRIDNTEKNARPFVPAGDVSSDDAEMVSFPRRMTPQKGKWRILPPGIEDIKE